MTKLVAGPSAYICDKCVAAAAAIIRDDGRRRLSAEALA